MSATSYLYIAVAALLVCIANCESCSKPEVLSSVSYTTEDATVLTNIAFITEFTIRCGNGVKNMPLYAEVNGLSIPAARTGDEGRYQVSWVEDVKKARSGNYEVSLYDEEGYAALRKATRSGEDPANVLPLATIVLNHPGAYQGPWVNSEFMAAVLSVVVWYLAFSAKSKLLA